MTKCLLLGTVVVAGGITSGRYLETVAGKPGCPHRAARRRRHQLRADTADLRRQQIQAVSSQQDLASNRRVHRQLNRNVLIAATTLVTAGAGVLVYTPLSYLAVLGILLVSGHGLRDALALWRQQRRLGVDALALLLRALLLLNFYVFLCSISTLLYSVNRKLMNSVKDHSTQNMIDVFRQTPREVWVMRDEVELQVPLESVTTEDVVVVHAGETIPVDGHILHGSGAVDQHVLNGESQPADKNPGDEVLALTVVLSGRIYIQTERTGEHTTATQIAQILTSTVDVKTDMQLWAESMTDRTVLPTCLLGLAALPWVGPLNTTAFLFSHPMYRTTLTGSICLLNGLNSAAQQGILIKDGRSLELLERVDTVVFDKTGTLTSTEPRLGEIHACTPTLDAEAVLTLAAAAEYKQSHPIARAILAAAAERELRIPQVQHTDYQLGHGLLVHLDDCQVRVGSANFMIQAGLAIPDSLQRVQRTCHDEGRPVVLVARDEQVVGAVELAVNIRPEARAVIQGLRRRGVREICIISGDHPAPTRQLAEALGVDSHFAQTLPEQKADRIAELQARGRTVCYVGDGINDAIALRQADVSVSLSGASTVAMDAAEVVLMDGSLHHLEALFDVASGVQHNIRRTFMIVFVPHAISAAGALLVLYHGMVPAFALTIGGLLAGLYSGTRSPRRRPRRLAAPVTPEKPIPLALETKHPTPVVPSAPSPTAAPRAGRPRVEREGFRIPESSVEK